MRVALEISWVLAFGGRVRFEASQEEEGGGCARESSEGDLQRLPAGHGRAPARRHALGERLRPKEGGGEEVGRRDVAALRRRLVLLDGRGEAHVGALRP